MNKLKRTLALVATLALATTAFVGCGDDSSSSAPSNNSSKTESKVDDSSTGDSSKTEGKAENKVPNTGSTLSILCWTGDDIKAMKDCFLANNSDVKDADITWVQCGTKGGDAAENYTQYFAGDEDVDLYIAEADWIMTFINDDAVSAPLSNLGLTDDDFKTNYDYIKQIGTDSKGVLKGTSWQSTPGGFAYRADLAKEYLGASTPTEMQEKVKDWDTFMESAKTISEKTEGKMNMTATIGGLWQVFSYNRAQAWVDKDNKLAIDDSCTKFMNMVKEMRDKNYVSGEDQWGDSWFALGANGDTFGYFVCSWCFGDDTSTFGKMQGGKDNENFGKWGFVKGPQEYAWGGSWLCLSPKADNGELAEKFVKFFCSNEETMKKYAEFKGEFVNSYNVMKSIVDAKTNKCALLADGQDQFATMIDVAAGINLDGKITPYDATIKNDYIDAVNGYVKGDTASVDDALKAFKTKVASDLPEQLTWE